MKNMRKLVPAFAMLMVAAIMMSTASFAWFSMSSTATATGMQVNAKADAGILISNGDGKWASSATAANADASLLPASTLNGTTWYTATSNVADDPNAGKVDTNYDVVPGGSTAYYLKNSFYIKSSSNEDLQNDIELTSITITESEDLLLNNAVRVLVVCGAKTYIYSVEERSYKVLTTPRDESDADSENEFTSVKSIPDGAREDSLGVTTIPKVTATKDGAEGTPTAIQVDVYVYFEGEDADCHSANLLDAVADITVDFEFTLGDSTAGTP